MGSREALFAALLAALLVSVPARAEPSKTDPFGPRQSASLSFFSFFGPGLTVEHETYVRPPWLSFVSGLGFRTTGGADFTTLTLTPSLEGRVWLGNIGPWRGKDQRMTGLLLALREDVAWTVVEDEAQKRLAGTAVELSETVSLGYRFLIWRVHITPLLGAALTTQLDPRGRLAPTTFLSGKLAVTFGIML